MSSTKQSKFLILLLPAKHVRCAGRGFADTALGPGPSVQSNTWIGVEVHPHPEKKIKKLGIIYIVEI